MKDYATLLNCYQPDYYDKKLTIQRKMFAKRLEMNPQKYSSLTKDRMRLIGVTPPCVNKFHNQKKSRRILWEC